MHSSGEKFICSGENILHHHPTEIAALSEQTSKYSNEHLVRTPNHYIYFFFLSDIHLCSRILWDSRIEWHARNAVIPGAPGPQQQQGKDGAKGKGPRGMTGRRGEKGNDRSRGNNGAPRMKGLK